jgi:hypothetical protein
MGKAMSIWIKTSLGWRPISSIASNHNECQGVFRPVTDVQAAAETMGRARIFEKDVARYLDGELDYKSVHSSFSVPIFGPFGEKL